MKPLIPFYLAITLTSADILHSASPAKALTWNFSYESNFPFNFGTQSGTFEAPGSENDGTHTITEFQFNHTSLPEATFDVPTNSPTEDFSTADINLTNQITISGGVVTKVGILVNNTAEPSSIAIDFEPAAFFEGVDIYNNVDRTGGLIDQSTFGVTFTPSSTVIPFDVNPLPAILLLTVGLGIERLVNKKQSQKNYQPTKQQDESTKLGLNHEPTKTQASGSLESN